MNNQNLSFIQIAQKHKVNHNDAKKEDVIEKKAPENCHDAKAALNKNPEESKFIIAKKGGESKQEQVDANYQDAENKKSSQPIVEIEMTIDEKPKESKQEQVDVNCQDAENKKVLGNNCQY